MKNRLVPYLVLFLASVTVSTMLFGHRLSILLLPIVAEVSSSAVSPSPTSSDDIPTKVSNLLANGDILGVNRLRRILQRENVQLYEKHTPLFLSTFENIRLNKARKHQMLHTPKSGGTSLCNFVKKTAWRTPKKNCWSPSMCPLWCCCGPGLSMRGGSSSSSSSSLSSCHHSTLSTSNTSTADRDIDFLMNENYLDEVLCPTQYLYSMLLRDPANRAMSHVNHLTERIVNTGYFARNQASTELGQRILLGASNYMTWSLTYNETSSANHVAPTSINLGNNMTVVYPMTYRPSLHDLPYALHRLAELDFLLDLSRNETTTTATGNNDDSSRPLLCCRDIILSVMGLVKNATGGTTIPMPTSNSRKGYQGAYDPTEFNHLNQLDMELYQTAISFIQGDCEFFAKLLERRARGGVVP